MTATDNAPGFRLTGWHVLAGVVGFFAVIIAVDASFLVAAYRTHPGEVSVTPYEDGLAYNRRLEQLRAQERLGWRASAAAAERAVAIEVRDAAGRPIQGLALTAKLERPATEAGRLTPVFREVTPGRYVAREPRLSGAWDLTAEGRDGAGRRFQLERRLTWP
ncbi:MAG: FixH family protein [Phenylobacterium sp.]|uniref:FixH family protein n=1 Tax=Phenylobacterium sp. TaxID=1871053 RepID=UPI001A3BD6AF|nr:FixH family protein [Phenylobacterium sp.]MBL8555838.1 FixH family protein [Phenylobacterium sp.]